MKDMHNQRLITDVSREQVHTDKQHVHAVCPRRDMNMPASDHSRPQRTNAFIDMARQSMVAKGMSLVHKTSSESYSCVRARVRTCVRAAMNE